MTRDENGRRGGPGKRPDRPRSDKGTPRRTAGGKPVGRRVSPKGQASPERHAPAAAPETIGRPVERQRIAKLMARVGLCSRRDAEVWIEDGRVELNGEILTSPATDVGPDDRIFVDGLPLPDAEKTRLFLFHKPRGLVTSDHDPEGRDTVADYLRQTWPDGPRVVTIGRLDINTEGLLLLTNDGGLARVLELPTTGWVRRYRVRAKGETDQAVLDRLRDGVTIDGIDYVGIEAKLDRVQGANSWLTMGLREGKNREIKRVLEHIGLEVNRLIRLSFGPFQLLDLPEGKVEEVKTRILRDQLGETLAAEAGVDFHDADAPIVAAPAPKPAERTSRRTETRPDRPASSARRGDAAERRPRDGLDRERPRSDGPRKSRDDEAAIEERAIARPRKHVSTLRASEASDKRSGPRKRIERADTLDANNRAVKVERLVRAREVVGSPEAPRAARRGAGRFQAREESDGARAPRREGRDPTARRGQGAHASPSALAKRERVFRSGGVAPPERGERRETKDRSRDFRDRENHATSDTHAPRRESGERPRARPDGERPARNGRPDKKPRSGKPFAGASAADRPVRDKRERSSEGRPSGDRPQRSAPRAGAAGERGDKRNATAGAPRSSAPRPASSRPDRLKSSGPKRSGAGASRKPGPGRSGPPRSGGPRSGPPRSSPPRGKPGGGPKR